MSTLVQLPKTPSLALHCPTPSSLAAPAVGPLFPLAAMSVDVGSDPGATGLNVPLNVGPGPGWESCMEWMAAGNRLRPFFHVSHCCSAAAALAAPLPAPPWPCLLPRAWPSFPSGNITV